MMHGHSLADSYEYRNNTSDRTDLEFLLPHRAMDQKPSCLRRVQYKTRTFRRSKRGWPPVLGIRDNGIASSNRHFKLTNSAEGPAASRIPQRRHRHVRIIFEPPCVNRTQYSRLPFFRHLPAGSSTLNRITYGCFPVLVYSVPRLRCWLF